MKTEEGMVFHSLRQKLSNGAVKKHLGRRASCNSQTVHARFEHLEDRLLLSVSGSPVHRFALEPFTSSPSEQIGQAEEVGAATTGESTTELTPAMARAADANGDSFATAADLGVLDGEKTVRAFVGGNDQRDIYRFQLDGEAKVEVALAGLSQDIDLYICDDAGRQLGRSIRPGRQSESFTQTLAPGTYHVLVAPYRSYASSYQLTIAATPTETAPPDGAGNNLTDARQLGSLEAVQTFQDWVGQADTADYYRFELDRDGDVEIQLTGLEQDIDLYIYDAAGNQLGRSIQAGQRPEAFSHTLVSGTYYALVTPYGSYASSYQLTLAATLTETAPPDAAGNSLADARQLGSLGTVQTFQDWVGQADNADYYRFELDRDGDVEIQLTGLEQDIDLYIYDDAGSQLGRSIQSGRQPETIRQTLVEGEYVVLVRPWGAAESDYSLSLQADLEQPPADSPSESGGDGAFPDVDYFGGANDWNLNSINAPEVWAQGYTGEGVVVAVVDTGIDASHPELSSSIWVNQGEIAGNGIDDDANGFVDDIHGWDFADGDNTTADLHGHGTHVAGTIAAANDGLGATGVAFGTTIMPVRVLDADGTGSLSHVAMGIRYAVDNGADIINLSLGGGYSSLLNSALAYAQQHGVFVVAAAGNEAATTPGYPAAFSADLVNVLSVGAYNQDDALAYFSNDVGGSGAVQIDAPGVSIYSSLPGNRYGYLSGTSMATPHVAGVAALALSANPDLTPESLRSLIVDGAQRPITGSDSLGAVDAAITVASAIGHTSSPTGQVSSLSSNGIAAGSSQPLLALDHVFAQLGHNHHVARQAVSTAMLWT